MRTEAAPPNASQYIHSTVVSRVALVALLNPDLDTQFDTYSAIYLGSIQRTITRSSTCNHATTRAVDLQRHNKHHKKNEIMDGVVVDVPPMTDGNARVNNGGGGSRELTTFSCHESLCGGIV